MLTEVATDELDDEALRSAIAALLGRGETEAALGELRTLARPFAGRDGLLPAGTDDPDVGEARLAGWNRLAERLALHDRTGLPVTAIAIELADPAAGDPRAYVLEVSYFTDRAFPFSQASFAGLAEGCADEPPPWAGQPAAIEETLRLTGADDLGAAVRRLEALAAAGAAQPHEIEAGMVGACLLAVLLQGAVERAIGRYGLPRPLAMLVGSGELYPFFRSPVLASGQDRSGDVQPTGLAGDTDAEDEWPDMAGWSDLPAPAPSQPQPDQIQAAQASPPAAEPGPPATEEAPDLALLHLPAPDIHLTGPRLRRKFVTPESEALIAAERGREGLLARISSAIARARR